MFATMTDDTNETANATKTTPSSSHSTSTRRWTTSTEERKSQSTTKSTKTESKATKTSTSSTKKPEPTHPAGITCDLKKVGDESSEFKPRDYVKAAFEAGVYQYCRGDYGWLVRPDDRGSGSNYFWFDTKQYVLQPHPPLSCSLLPFLSIESQRSEYSLTKYCL